VAADHELAALAAAGQRGPDIAGCVLLDLDGQVVQLPPKPAPRLGPRVGPRDPLRAVGVGGQLPQLAQLLDHARGLQPAHFSAAGQTIR
jgi:hypothetical protein